MLHILNGESTERTLKQSSVPGVFFSFREVLDHGPTPTGTDEQEWRRIRSAHLVESYGVEIDACEQGLLSQEETLRSSSQHEEVVLWFEHDLFCQINLLYLLNWYAPEHLGQTKLSLINIGEFPGRENFRGLGELNAEQLASLFPQRQPVTPAQLNLAKAAWAAYRSPDPTAIETLLNTDTSALPFLPRAFQAHLKRFPATKNGLGQVENRSLELINNGFEKFIDLFPRFGNAEPVYGLGDAQLWLSLRMLISAHYPLLTVVNAKAKEQLAPNVINNAKFKLTEAGHAVLNGEADFVTLNSIELWLGGVHLSGSGSVWRWNEASEKLEIS
jgi:hypothetical protein